MTNHEYPECEKMARARPKSQAIGEFLDWLQNEKGIQFGKTPTDEQIEEVEDTFGESWPDIALWPETIRTEEILAEFFDIDLDKVEKEKREMLKKIREEKR